MDEELNAVNNSETSQIIEDEVNVVGGESPEIVAGSELPQDTVYVAEEDVINIEIDEGFIVSGLSPEFNHSLLDNRDQPDQHTIDSITGLRDELNDIRALGSVYSNKINHAEYFLWNDQNIDKEMRDGLFVTLCEDVNQIEICRGSNVFGVTVNNAAMVGNQSDVARDYTYGLVVRSGLVSVRCESDVNVGDYVMPNTSGVAKRVDDVCGCAVVALSNIKGVAHAIISLSDSMESAHVLSNSVEQLNERVADAETNIVSAINVANEAHNLASDMTRLSEEIDKKVNDAVSKVESSVKDAEDFYESIKDASSIAEEAKAIAQSAATYSETIKNEAIKTANEAWAKADNISKEFMSLVATIDTHSVGEYSQAYNLTMEQAASILQEGMIYVPTKHAETDSHSEEYLYDDGRKEVYEFTPGYHYIWDGGIWQESGSPSVYFTYERPTPTDKYIYWYTGNDIQDEKYDKQTLYLYKDGDWMAVATLSGNYLNRSVSMIQQTSNNISASVSNARNDIAEIDIRLDEHESRIAMVVEADGGVNASIIVDAINNADSSVVINANHVVIDGTTTFLTKDDVGKNGTTVIDGGRILSGLIDAKYINADTLTAKHIDSIDGNIGGFEIGDNSLHTNGKTSYNSKTTGVYVGNDGIGLGDGKFYVTKDGKLYVVYGSVGGWNLDSNSLYSGSTFSNSDCFLCTGSTGTSGTMSIGGSSEISGWTIKAGDKFGVTKNGALYASDAYIQGKMTATSGYIGNGTDGFTINQNGMHSEARSVFAPVTDPSRTGVYIGSSANIGLENSGGISIGSNDSATGNYYEQFLYSGRHIILGKVAANKYSGVAIRPQGVFFMSATDSLGVKSDVDETDKIAASIEVNPGYAKLNKTWKTASAIEVTSARNAKTDIEALDDRHSILFDNLIPRQFKYVDGTNDRTHYGLIVDELRSAMDVAGIAPEECAAYCLDDPSKPDGDGGIRYSELLALCIKEIQTLKQEIKELKKNKMSENNV